MTDVGVAVTDLRVVCKIITCVSAFTEAFTKMAIIFLEIVKAAAGLGHSALQATQRMPLWALAIALATGKNTKLFGVLDQNENGFFTYVSQRAESRAATVTMSLGSFTVAGDFVLLQLIRLGSLGSKLEES